MVAVGHIASGFIIGKTVVKFIDNDVLAAIIGLIAGIILHYILDIIPHGHFTKKPKYTSLTFTTVLIYIDLLGGVGIFSLLSILNYGISYKFLVVMVSIFGSLLPDFISAFDELFFKSKLKRGILGFEHKLHLNTHWHGSGDKTRLISQYDIWQAVVLILALYWS